MKKLRGNGYITMADDGTITLSDSGLEIANRVYGRHKLLAELFRLPGVIPEQAAADACKVKPDLFPRSRSAGHKTKPGILSRHVLKKRGQSYDPVP